MIGAEFSRVIDAVNSLRPVGTPGMLTSRTTAGVKTTSTQGITTASARQEWFRVVDVTEDYLICLPLNSLLWVQYQTGVGSHFLVAKPYALRTDWLTGGAATRGGFTFEPYSPEPTQSRYIQHDSHSPEKDIETIYPKYSVGDLVLANEILDQPTIGWSTLSQSVYTSLGLVTSSTINPPSPTPNFPSGTIVKWLDANIDARRWASLGLLTGDRLATGDSHGEEHSLRVVGFE